MSEKNRIDEILEKTDQGNVGNVGSIIKCGYTKIPCEQNRAYCGSCQRNTMNLKSKDYYLSKKKEENNV